MSGREKVLQMLGEVLADVANGLQLEVLNPGAMFSNLRIRMKPTSQNTLNDNVIENTGFVEVYFLNTTETSKPITPSKTRLITKTPGATIA